MATDRQIAANRSNAEKSTGPKTPEGRAAVRLNGVKHGLTAETLVLPGESVSDFHALLAGFESEHQPATPTEEALVRQMAMAQWRLRRLYHVEAAFFNLRLIDLEEEIDDNYNNLDAADKLAVVVKEDSYGSSVLENLSRLEGRLERSFHRSLRELQRLRAARPQKLENQTQFQEPAPAPESEPKPFLVKPVESKGNPAHSETPSGNRYSLQLRREERQTRREQHRHRAGRRNHRHMERFRSGSKVQSDLSSLTPGTLISLLNNSR